MATEMGNCQIRFELVQCALFTTTLATTFFKQNKRSDKLTFYPDL